MSAELIKATLSDTATIAKLATEIWNEHYPSIISREQIDYMLEKMYSAATLKKLIESGEQHFYLVMQNENPVGFISLSTEDDRNWMLHKFYVLSSARGIGSEVFMKIVDLLKPATVRLTVNRQNYKSINFYFKNGFVIEKVADFDIGNGYFMNDFLMVWMKLKGHGGH